MTLARGTNVGPYEIVSLRGAGGMGEVYRARDTRLDRTVAIKILPRSLGANETLRTRFEREARAISALSHPNICAVYDVGRDDGTDYLVMEYLEGETLAERLARGPLPASMVIRFGAQIAEALHQAHRAGITHRDLKPGNVMITAAGAKLLDFGLAKFTEAAVISSHSAPTIANALTAEGTIVGTAHYMAPEQIEGKNVDSRSDIFSLGVMLFEMATGQRPFRGDSPASLIAAILSSDPPPVRSLQPAVSPALERIIMTALEKNPDERWQTAHDLGRQLRWISESSVTVEQAAPLRQRRVPIVGMLVVAAIVGGLVTFAATRFLARPKSGREHLSLQLAQPAGLEPVRSPETVDFALSPDGRTLAFFARANGASSLFLRRLDSFEATRVDGADGASGVFWSPDAEWLGYSARGKLWKRPVGGGAPAEAICDVTTFGARASWAGHTILFADARADRSGIFRVADSGGPVAKVTAPKANEWRHSWPVALPDGEHFLYLSFGRVSLARELRLASLVSPEQSVLLRDISFARLAGPDRLLYVRDGELLSQQFDVDRGVMIGAPSTVAASVSYFYPTARADFDVSPSGVVVYRTDTSTGRLALVGRNGSVLRTIDDTTTFWDNSVSRDGRKAAVTVVTRGTGLMDIWIYDLARGVRDRFTSEPGIEVSPSWAPDGQSIVYSQGEGGVFPHLVRRPLGGSASEALTPAGSFQFSAHYSPDGKSVYYADDRGLGSDIYRLTVETRKTEPFLASEFKETFPVVSPDGQWLAYSSNATGEYEVYLQRLAGGDATRIRLSRRGGNRPMWRADGRELFYVTADQMVTSVVSGASGWEEATTAELFRVGDELRSIDVLPDGQSFLVSNWKAGPHDFLFHVIAGPR